MELLIITALVIAVYARTINYSIVVDDVTQYKFAKDHPEEFSLNFHIKSGIKGLISFLKLRLYGGATFGLNTKIDHAFTIFLHAVTCVLIYIAFGSNQISFWAAILYSVHPLNNQTAIWLNGRRYQINIILVLAMLCLAKITPLAFLLYFITPLFQVTAIFAPVLFAHQYPILLAIIPAVLFLSYKAINDKIQFRLKSIHDEDRLKFTPKRLIVIVKYFGHYFARMILPVNCLQIYKEFHFWGRTEEGNKDAYGINGDFILGALSLGLCAVVMFALPADLRPLAFFMTLSLLQWCAVLPFIQDLADRYASLPNVFAMFFISYFAHQLLGSHSIPVIVALGAYYFARLQNIIPMYKDYPSMWAFQRYFNPSTPSPRFREIQWNLDKKDLTRAWTLIREGLAYTPNDFILLHQASICHYGIGELGIARAYLNKAMSNYYLYQKDTVEPELKKFSALLDAYGQAQRVRPPAFDQERSQRPEPMNRQQRRAQERQQGKLVTV